MSQFHASLKTQAYKLKLEGVAMIITLVRVASVAQVEALIQKDYKELLRISNELIASSPTNTTTADKEGESISQKRSTHIALFHVLCSVIAADVGGKLPPYLPKLMERLIKIV
uniref:Glutamyl-tRNA(Gln) amidotransferase subunit A n=1 Tax=Lygus hesperus TaxID=30085 RepID=A0A0A9WV43_LYGHE